MDLKRDLSVGLPKLQWRQTRLCLFVSVIAVVATIPAGAARAQGNSVCSHWCVANFPPGAGRGQCVSQAAQGAGPCFVCGPRGNSAGLCGGICCPPGEACNPAGACVAPTPTPPPLECGVVSGDPSAGTAMCGGRCPLEFPFCEFVPAPAGGRCTCVDHQCGTAGLACSGNFCPSQEQTCTTLADGSCACGPAAAPTPTETPAVSCGFSGSPPICGGACPDGQSCETFPSPADPAILACGCVPLPTPTPLECGVVSGDPSAGTAMCGGRCPLEFPFCEFVPAPAGGRCTCVDHQCGTAGLACSSNFCPSQEQTCTTLADGSCACE